MVAKSKPSTKKDLESKIAELEAETKPAEVKYTT